MSFTPIAAGNPLAGSISITDNSLNVATASQSISLSGTATQVSQTITFNNPGAQNFGTSPTLSATASSGLAVSFSSDTTSICTVTSGGALTFLTAGTCAINADQAGSSEYDAATTVMQSLFRCNWEEA